MEIQKGLYVKALDQITEKNMKIKKLNQQISTQQKEVRRNSVGKHSIKSARSESPIRESINPEEFVDFGRNDSDKKRNKRENHTVKFPSKTKTKTKNLNIPGYKLNLRNWNINFNRKLEKERFSSMKTNKDAEKKGNGAIEKSCGESPSRLLNRNRRRSMKTRIDTGDISDNLFNKEEDVGRQRDEISKRNRQFRSEVGRIQKQRQAKDNLKDNLIWSEGPVKLRSLSQNNRIIGRDANERMANPLEQWKSISQKSESFIDESSVVRNIHANLSPKRRKLVSQHLKNENLEFLIRKKENPNENRRNKYFNGSDLRAENTESLERKIVRDQKKPKYGTGRNVFFNFDLKNQLKRFIPVSDSSKRRIKREHLKREKEKSQFLKAFNFG